MMKFFKAKIILIPKPDQKKCSPVSLRNIDAKNAWGEKSIFIREIKLVI